MATETVQKNLLANASTIHPKLKMMFSDAETTVFSGRAIVALASDPKVMTFTGKVLQNVELAHHYSFTDVAGMFQSAVDF